MGLLCPSITLKPVRIFYLMKAKKTHKAAKRAPQGKSKARNADAILNDIHEGYKVSMKEALQVVDHLENELERKQMAVGMMNAISLALRILQTAPADFESYFRQGLPSGMAGAKA
jgi:hypothetical protein